MFFKAGVTAGLLAVAYAAPATPASQLSDGQPQVQSASQISDGQVQVPSASQSKSIFPRLNMSSNTFDSLRWTGAGSKRRKG